MPLRQNLIGSGASTELSKHICGAGPAAISAAGNSQATATPLADAVNVVSTVSASQGVILRGDLNRGEEQTVINTSATTLAVYPPVGGTINGGSANASVNLLANKRADFMCVLPGLNFTSVISG